MSSNVRSYGLMAILDPAIERTEEFSEKLYDENSLIQVNYEGTLVYFDENISSDFRDDIYGLWFGLPESNMEVFTNELNRFGLKINSNTVRPFHCVWYNGSDSDMDMLSLEEFKKQTGQS
jgi:hypothetical protein